MTATDMLPPSEWPWEPDLVAALGARPVRVEVLLAQLAADYPQLSADDVTHCLKTRADVLHIEDEGWVSLLAVAQGAVLTHVLTAEERALGVLVADGDLDLWARLADEGLPLAAGGEARARWALDPQPVPHGVGTGLVGPDGWLDGYEPGTTLGLRLQDGALVVEALEPFGHVDELDEQDRGRVQQVVDQVLRDASVALEEYLTGEEDAGPSAFLDGPVAVALYRHPGLLDEPLPPLGQLLRAAGIRVDRGMASLPGLPSDREVDDLDEAEIRAVVGAHALLPQLRAGEPPAEEQTRLLLTWLQLSAVIEDVADAVELAPLPVAVSDALLATAGDAERPGALLLAARSAEGRGEYPTAERLVTEAAESAPTLLPAALDAAQYAAARGDARRADDLLQRAGVGAGDPTRQALRPLLSLPNGVVSRNRPCPCGSGRKYKVCCLRDVQHPLPLRARLAYTRLYVHAQRPGLFETAGRFASVVGPQAFELSLDMAVFEGGVIEHYLESRGHLLAEDERALLESWVGTPLAAYEVVDVQPRRTVTVRRLPTEELVVLADRAFSMAAQPLDVVQARLLWDGEKVAMLCAPLLVHRSRRAALVALLRDGHDPDELAEFWGPPSLVDLWSGSSILEEEDLDEQELHEEDEEDEAGFEQRWLDAELAELGGRTPRGAVAEGGEALAELQAVLDDMAWVRREYPEVGGMDPARLRDLLGLSDASRVVER